jgi:K+-transporting ATPase ATPase A chain
MDSSLLAILQVGALALILVAIHRPLGDYMARIYSSKKDLRVERGFYRLIGVDARAEQSWKAYLRSVLAFSLVGVLLVYGIQRAQAVLPYSLGLPAVPEGLSFNTAVSFVTNTNWQSYSPDVTMGYTVQLAGLAVQNSSRPRWESPWPSPWCAASPAPARAPSATSGST